MLSNKLNLACFNNLIFSSLSFLLILFRRPFGAALRIKTTPDIFPLVNIYTSDMNLNLLKLLLIKLYLGHERCKKHWRENIPECSLCFIALGCFHHSKSLPGIEFRCEIGFSFYYFVLSFWTKVFKFQTHLYIFPVSEANNTSR